jgi:hypothetical protein
MRYAHAGESLRDVVKKAVKFRNKNRSKDFEILPIQKEKF